MRAAASSSKNHLNSNCPIKYDPEKGACLHHFANRPLVLIQHWVSSSQQVFALQLWLQVPNLPHNVPHVGMCNPQIYFHRFSENGSSSDGQIEIPGFENINLERCVLWVGCRWEYLSPIPSSFVQSGGGCYDALFYSHVAYFMTFKREAWVTYAALVPVVTGVVIASGGEPSFHLFGFIMCISATAARAFKSVLQGILLSSDGEKLNSMNLMLYMSPIAVLVLLPAALIMEPNVISSIMLLGKEHKFMWILLLVNSVMAYSANLSNFLVTKHTSALTLQVLGNAKGAVAVVISILLFRNPVTFVGMAGYTITVLGVVAYGETKRRFR